MIEILSGDCLDVLARLPEASVDACVTDPPYHLTTGKRGGSGPASASDRTPHGRARIGTGFMGKAWDGGDVAFRVETWEAVLRVLKPGGHLLAFGGTRTWHRMVCAIEDAGAEIRDQIMWTYGGGFPKSHNIAKAIDKRHPAGVSEPWTGWGTALKPSWEPVIVARKPFAGTVAENVLRHGTGALNIDGCRVQGGERPLIGSVPKDGAFSGQFREGSFRVGATTLGRWPANLIHDGSDEVLRAFAAFGNRGAVAPVKGTEPSSRTEGIYNGGMKRGMAQAFYGDTGSAARFFYCAKAGKADRAGSKHPTVKPVALMRHLVRLVTPPGGVVLDPFAGSGTTGAAAEAEGCASILVERDPGYVRDLRRRFAGTGAGAGQARAPRRARTVPTSAVAEPPALASGTA